MAESSTTPLRSWPYCLRLLREVDQEALQPSHCRDQQLNRQLLHALTAFTSSNEVTADVATHTQSVQDIQHRAWDMIHSGSWRDVPLHWRELYSLASSILAILDLWHNMPDQAIRTLDLAIMMGTPSRHQWLHSLIRTIESSTETSTNKTTTNINHAPGSDNGALLQQQHQHGKQATPTDATHLSHHDVSPILRVEQPSLIEFKQRFMDTGTPVIITDGMQSWYRSVMLCTTAAQHSNKH
jgi:D-ribose pyranose/furanose isomerase RbsD